VNNSVESDSLLGVIPVQHYFLLHPYILYLFLFGMAFLSGFIDTIAGGGGLISVPALMYSGLPVTMALGTNKFQSIFGLSIAVYKYHRRGFINFKMIYRGLLMGLLGAGSGAVLVNYISNQFMQYIIPFLRVCKKFCVKAIAPTQSTS
jgi:uncharacterized membrane protein YfcA